MTERPLPPSPETRWSAFWFRPASPVELGICRVLFFAGILLYRLPARAHDWGRVPKMFYKPIWLFDVLNLQVLSRDTLRAVEIGWWIVLLMAAIGAFTRTTIVISLILGLYLLGLPNNFGKVGHGDQLTVLIMLIFALSSCGDAFSLDSWFARRRGSPLPAPSPEYRWPIRMVWVLIASVFFAAGVTKLVKSGVAWVNSDSFEITLLQAHYGLNRPPTNWGLYLAQVPWLCKTFAGASLLLELMFPLALLGRRFRMAIVPAALFMQIGIGLLMGIWFVPFLITYLFWVPWERVLKWGEKRIWQRADLPVQASYH